MVSLQDIQQKYISLTPVEKALFNHNLVRQIVDDNYGGNITNFYINPESEGNTIFSGRFDTPRPGGKRLVIDYSINDSGITLTPRNPGVIDSDEYKYSELFSTAMQMSAWLDYAPIEVLSYARSLQCHKGWACGGACLSKEKKNCNKNLNEKHKTYLGWLQDHVNRGTELHKGHREEAVRHGISKEHLDIAKYKPQEKPKEEIQEEVKQPKGKVKKKTKTDEFLESLAEGYRKQKEGEIQQLQQKNPKLSKLDVEMKDDIYRKWGESPEYIYESKEAMSNSPEGEKKDEWMFNKKVLKNRYLNLAKRYHPDVSGSNNTSEQMRNLVDSYRHAKEINDAYSEKAEAEAKAKVEAEIKAKAKKEAKAKAKAEAKEKAKKESK
ncbi:MAG: hypothetical protein PUP93_30825 [Rhizonema sp. NSF051]|nr:hypothetical protein [Rhizonema sp. NSF051]